MSDIKSQTVYMRMYDEGATPEDLYNYATASGLCSFESIRMLRVVCGLSLVDAKQIMVISGTKYKSLSEYQGKVILPALEELERLGEFDTNNDEEE